MARMERNAVVLSENDIAAINKVNQVIDAFLSLISWLNPRMKRNSGCLRGRELESMDKKAG